MEGEARLRKRRRGGGVSGAREGRNLGRKAWSSTSYPPHPLPYRTGTYLGTHRSPLCSHRTGRLHSWLALCHTRRCLQRGRQGGNFDSYRTSREAEAGLLGNGPAHTPTWARDHKLCAHTEEEVQLDFGLPG